MKKGGQKAKTSLKELLALHPEPQRNDWSNGRPKGEAQSARIGPDGFPEYDPKAFESDDDGEAGPSAGGAFAVLAGLGGRDDGGGEDDEWEVVTAKTKRRGNPPGTSTARPSAPAPAPASRPVPPMPTPVPAVFRPPSAVVQPSTDRFMGPMKAAGRAPYAIGAAVSPAPPPHAPRAPTHGPDGKPLSDSYYQTFQRVYRNANGAVCLRFHKTDIVVVRPNGEVVLTSGGYKTRTTFCSVAEGIEPLGLTLRSSGGEGRGDWFVELPDGGQLPWEDGMTVPASGPEDRGRGNKLFAAFYGTAAAAAPAATGRAAAAPAPQAPRPQQPLIPGMPPALSAAAAAAASRAVGAAPAPAAAASTWSYRTASLGAGSSGGGSSSSAYAAHLRPAAAVPMGPRPADPGDLAALLDHALAMQDAAEGADGGAGGLDDEAACIVCMAAAKCCILIPCGHLVLCEACTEDVVARSNECPMCRERVETHMTVS
ncbi:hypothetical protein GPECTOR_9g556 [Gonium pectorale]|uniref:RING-type domain-containing protein n=1 Tax=Gonium pectorale TaxID=33097 RepID=A0A150GRZ3_GONPE|nr:hypothetical protein GPECTOR_9g556 [Gonium pectorale]|eukprot:KXZ52512.1 hypothetical protein GPECTOR_9g556 [Gonium pectorale]